MASSSSQCPPRTCSQSQRLLMFDWSKLPYDLISLIANKLHAVEDFFSFSAVCRSWRLIYKDNNWTPSLIVPWLMLDEKKTDDVSVRHFFNICKNKAYEIPLRETHGRRCWGSSYGWVVTIGKDLVISLLNPVTRVCFHLPSHFTLENRANTNIDLFGLIHKANVFKIRDGFVIVAIYGQHYSLAFARVGDSAWSNVQIPGNLRLVNVTCFEGKIYAVSFVGVLVLVNIDGADPPTAELISPPPRGENSWKQILLVESAGDLLMILDRNPKFKVYKFDFNAREWMILGSLGDRALFVDDSCSFSISARDRDGLVSDSIYFVKDNLGWWLGLEHLYEYGYRGVYHMEDETVETISLNRPGFLVNSAHYTCPVWLVPTL